MLRSVSGWNVYVFDKLRNVMGYNLSKLTNALVYSILIRVQRYQNYTVTSQILTSQSLKVFEKIYETKLLSRNLIDLSILLKNKDFMPNVEPANTCLRSTIETP